MLVRNKVPWKDIFKRNWPILSIIGLYAFAVYYGYKHSDEEVRRIIDIPTYIPGILGTSMSFFLGFITNSAYDRWWEARKQWGAIVNDSRSWSREIQSLAKEAPQEEREALILRQIAWCHSLKRSLRKVDPMIRLNEFLSPQELTFLRARANVPFSILEIQGKHIKNLADRKLINDYEMVQLDATLNRLSDHMGACERIKNTIFPVQYSFFVHVFILLFLFLLPNGTVASMGIFSVILTLGLALIYMMIETIEISMQDPFDMEASDTPMSAIVRTIEIDLKQSINHSDIPEPLKPVDGILI